MNSSLNFIKFECLHFLNRVRLVKVIRNRDGTQDILQYNVQLMLEGDNMASAFLEGDNSKVVPTDTCKNTVYCLASQNTWQSIEEFGLIICKHFLTEYPQWVNKITVTIQKDVWNRLNVPDSNGRIREHAHAFQRVGPFKPYTICVGEKRANTNFSFSVKSGFKGLEILKTTQSGFVGYPKDRYTSLPESTDRILGTSAEGEWVFNNDAVNRGRIDYTKVFDVIVEALLQTFAGPADKGIYSKSVQETLYLMCCDALKKTDSVDEITMYMPNIHNMTFPLETYGFKNKDHTGNPFIFFPIDEPHGAIRVSSPWRFSSHSCFFSFGLFRFLFLSRPLW